VFPGGGCQQEELEAVAVDFHKRDTLFDEALDEIHARRLGQDPRNRA
jgi:hypothetical protein